MSAKPILCLDFDGVVHSYTSGWKGASVIPDAPVSGAFEFMHRALNSGFDVAIHSSRSGQWGGRRAMRRWLRQHADASMWFEGVGEIGLEDVLFPVRKPPAFLTIDDRALTFTGNWQDFDLESLRSFKPWNKRKGN